MEIFYTHKARNDLINLPRNIQKRIAKKMRFYASQKNPLKFAKKLKNPLEGEYRFRIGDYRIFFDFKDDKIFVLRIKHRARAY